MIATLTGVVAEKLDMVLVLDVAGVGYGVLVTSADWSCLSIGQTAKLYIYEHIREQSHDLFGFSTPNALKFFELLLGVNGVGPKMAMNILGTGSAEAVRGSIAGGDVKFLQQASGVGRRVAERIVVELKDKVGLQPVDLAAAGLLVGESFYLQDEAAEALVALGYSAQDAAAALAGIEASLPTEERIRQVLTRKAK